MRLRHVVSVEAREAVRRHEDCTRDNREHTDMKYGELYTCVPTCGRINMTPKLPEYLSEQPDLVDAILEARRVQMETEDTSFAIEWLLEHHGITLASATKALRDETFRHPALYPKGHPGLDAINAENKAKNRRAYNRQKLRPCIIERDDSRCQNCNKRVWGREAQLDHKDPEGPETLDNLILLCQRCNLIKGRRTWDEFQEAQHEWREQLRVLQNARPDLACKKTGLSIKGRTWAEAGCLSPSACIGEKMCHILNTDVMCDYLKEPLKKGGLWEDSGCLSPAWCIYEGMCSPHPVDIPC